MTDPIVIERLLETNPEETFALLTQPERLRRWQAISAAVDMRVGGDYRFTVMPGNIAAGSIVELDPGRRLVMTWGWADNDEVPPGSTTLVVELEPEGEKTRVRFTHEGLEGVWAERHNDGWNHHLDRLVTVAGGDQAEHHRWEPQPDELNFLSVAEATWALCREQLTSVSPDQQDLPTPCDEFNLHELVVHLRSSLEGLAASAGGTIDETMQSSTAEDYVAVAAEAALGAWRANGVEGDVPFGQGSAPASLPAGILSLEFLVHAWDIAQTLGHEFSVSDSISVFVLDLAESIISGDVRGPGRFDAAQEPDGDDTLSRLVAFTGRKPL